MLDNSIIALSSAIIGIAIAEAAFAGRTGTDNKSNKYLLTISLLFTAFTREVGITSKTYRIANNN